jgi:hypothetical protein
MNKAILAVSLLMSMCVLGIKQEAPTPDNNEKVLENEYVRVSKLDLGTKPSELGLAALPTVVIILEQFTKAEWTELGSNQLTYKFVDISYAEGGHKLLYSIHEFPGPEFREIKIELKGPPPVGTFEKDAVKLDPKHNEVLFENDRVRVVRVHFLVGQEGPIVDKRPRVIILLTDTHAQVRTPNGQLSPRDSLAGSIQWSLGGRQATINGNVGPLENIVVELKVTESKPK